MKTGKVYILPICWPYGKFLSPNTIPLVSKKLLMILINVLYFNCKTVTLNVTDLGQPSHSPRPQFCMMSIHT